MLFANSTEITQCNQKAQDHREEVEQYFPAGFLAFVDRAEQHIHTKTSKEQVKTKAILFWQEKENLGREPVHCKPEGDDNLQIQTQTDWM